MGNEEREEKAAGEREGEQGRQRNEGEGKEGR